MRKLESKLISREPSDTPGYTTLSYLAINSYNFRVPTEHFFQYGSKELKNHYRKEADYEINKDVFGDLSDILHKTIYYIQSLRCESVYEDTERSLILKDLHKLLDDLD